MQVRSKSACMLLLIGCMFFPMIGFAKAMPDSLHIGVQNDTSEWKPIHVEYIHAAANVEPKGKDTIQNVSDTTYFKTYSDQITGRFYFSRKYTSLVIGDQQSEFKLDYRPNTSLNGPAVAAGRHKNSTCFLLPKSNQKI